MNTVTNIITMADKPWPSPVHFADAFVAGLASLLCLYWIVRLVMWRLRLKAGTGKEFAEEKSIGFSTTFAAIEQFLFYLAGIAGREVFGFAVGGWLVFKSVSRYARWQASDPAAQVSPIARPVQQAGLSPNHYAAAMAHNRFLIFILGTGLSVASGGIAGVIYHYVLDRLKG